jgi:hypothetical protein
VEGFGETFLALFTSIYGDITAGNRPAEPHWATFEDGHHEMLICDAVIASNRERRWVDVAEA